MPTTVSRALEWETFQHFLKTVSALKRVVFLLREMCIMHRLHMEYWNQHTHESAKLVDFTSSPFCNEGAGAHIAMLAIGYPRLLHLLRRQGTPTMDFFAWDIAPGDWRVLNRVCALIRQRIHLFCGQFRDSLLHVAPSMRSFCLCMGG